MPLSSYFNNLVLTLLNRSRQTCMPWAASALTVTQQKDYKTFADKNWAPKKLTKTRRAEVCGHRLAKGCEFIKHFADPLILSAFIQLGTFTQHMIILAVICSFFTLESIVCICKHAYVNPPLREYSVYIAPLI